jgi:penicillin-binding protein 2
MTIDDDITKRLNKTVRKKRKFPSFFSLEEVSPYTTKASLQSLRINRSKSVLFALLLVFAGFIFLISKVFLLQIIEGGINNEKALQNTYRYEIIQPYRGAILDRNGHVLVRNEPAFAIQLDVARCRQSLTDIKPECAVELKQLRQILPHAQIDSDSQIIKQVTAGSLVHIVAKKLSKDDVLLFTTRVNRRYLSQTLLPARNYLYPHAFAHVLGFTGIGNTLYPSIQGKDGIEKYYDNFLSGIAGEKIYRVTSSGEIQETVSEKNAIAGSDLQLSLDKNLQLLSYELLKDKTVGKKVFGGAVVAQDPQTGSVLALVSYPSFDAKKMSSGLSSAEYATLLKQGSQPFFNRAVSGAYPPGSTFKMVTSTAGLMEKTITEKTTVFDPGYIKVGTFIFRNWKLDGHGTVDIYTALQKSNDTYFYSVGGGHGGIKGLGIKRLNYWAKQLGYGSKTGIDLFGENAGFIPDGTHRQWYLGDDFISAIGQGDLLATPLQVNNTTTYFANGGKLYVPKIIKTDDMAKPVKSNIASPEVIDIVRQGMLLSVQPGGTGYPFFDFEQKYGFKVAGKTGTSEFINSSGKPDTHGWFTVFAPYENPTIALTVFLEGGSTGADDAAVIARQLIDQWFKQ